MLNDKMIQAKKQRKKSFDLRKTTKAQEGQLKETKKRLERIHEAELRAQTPAKKHVAGAVSQYYPSAKGNQMMMRNASSGLANSSSLHQQ